MYFFVKYDFLVFFILFFLLGWAAFTILALGNLSLGNIILFAFVSLLGILGYSIKKYTKEKTEQLLQIKTISEVEYILKDVPPRYLDTIYENLREKRFKKKTTIEIEETLEKILQEKK